MSRQTAQKLEDLAKWYYEHRPIVQQYDLIKRVEFLETVIHNILYLQTYAVAVATGNHPAQLPLPTMDTRLSRAMECVGRRRRYGGLS